MSKLSEQNLYYKVENVEKYKYFRYFVIIIKQYKNGNFSNSVKGFMRFESAKRYKLLMILNKKVIQCNIVFNDINY